MTSLHAIVRRSAEHPAVASFVKRTAYEGSGDDLPAAGIIFIAVTFFVAVIGLSLFEYTLKDVVATLAMVETPAAAVTISPSSKDESKGEDEKEGLLESGPTITLVHQKPVTSSIRGTIRHLVSTAGRWSRFRGIKLHALHSLCFTIMATVLDGIVPNVPGKMVIVPALAGASCANIHAAWTHKVVAVPNDKTFKERFVACSNWKVLALPAAIQASAAYLSVYIGQGLVVLLGLNRVSNDNFAEYTGKEWTSLALRSFAIVLVILSCALFIVLPALVTLIRVEASILPEDEDTIVPFDRTFAGKVVPKVLGGSGAIGFLDAWKSFNWEARRRLIKLYVKIFAIMSFLCIAFGHVLALLILVIIPSKTLKGMMSHGNRDNFF